MKPRVSPNSLARATRVIILLPTSARRPEARRLVPKFLVKHRKHQASITAIRKNIIPKDRRYNPETPTESIIRQLDPSIKEKYESAVRRYQEEKKLIIIQLEKTKQNIQQNQKNIKELFGLDGVSKKSRIRTYVNFLFNFFTENQKIKIQLIKKNKELEKKKTELQKRLQEFLRFSYLD